MVSEVGKDKVCPLCGGFLHEDTATLPFSVKESVVVVKNVAAEVCEDCGQAFLSGKATDAVTALLQEAVNRQMELTVVKFPAETPVLVQDPR